MEQWEEFRAKLKIAQDSDHPVIITLHNGEVITSYVRIHGPIGFLLSDKEPMSSSLGENSSFNHPTWINPFSYGYIDVASIDLYLDPED